MTGSCSILWALDGQNSRKRRPIGCSNLVGMSGFAERPCGELAYGDLKRLELAIRARQFSPKLLLMDEPTAGMAAARNGSS